MSENVRIIKAFKDLREIAKDKDYGWKILNQAQVLVNDLLEDRQDQEVKEKK